ncbi:MAG TPA: invasion associated locus B family protein [Devosia sp.]|nr:invasion associated locus B family protein [Devosia sp.]
MRLTSIAKVFAAALLVQCGAAGAAESLPGGASSLREAHADWVLNCTLPAKREGAPAPTVTCAISQELIQQSTKRRALVIALTPTPEGGTKGNVIMPFGLALSKGVQFQIDEGPLSEPSAFRTCTPQGCIVPIEWGPQTASALAAAGKLNIAATMDSGQPVSFTISLKGFSAGSARALELTR